MSSDPPTSNQPDNPTSTDPLIEYSRALYEYTLDLWWRTIRLAEERGQNPLEPFRLQEYYASQSIQQQTAQQQPTQIQPPQEDRESTQEGSHNTSPPRTQDTT